MEYHPLTFELAKHLPVSFNECYRVGERQESGRIRFANEDSAASVVRRPLLARLAPVLERTLIQSDSDLPDLSRFKVDAVKTSKRADCLLHAVDCWAGANIYLRHGRACHAPCVCYGEGDRYGSVIFRRKLQGREVEFGIRKPVSKRELYRQLQVVVVPIT